MADTVEIIFGAKIDGLVSGVAQVKQQLVSVENTAEAVSSSIKSLLAAVGVGLSVAGFIGFVNTMSELGNDLDRTANRIGVTNQQIVEMAGMARITGSSIEGMSAGIERMSFNIQRAKSNTIDPTSQALKVLGLNAKDLVGIGTEQLFLKLAGAVEKFNPSLNLSNALMQIGGKTFRDLAPVLSEGVEGYRRYQASIKAASQGLAEAIPGMADTNTKLSLLGLSAQSLGARIFTVLKPSIDLVVESVTKWIQSLDSKTIVGAVQQLVEYTAQAMLAIGNLAIGIFETLAQLSGGIDPIVKKLEVLVLGAALGGSIAGLRGALAGAGIAAAVAQFAEKYQKLEESTTKTNTNLDAQRERLAKIVAGFKELFSSLNIAPGLKNDKPDGANAGAIDFNIANKLAAQASNIDTQIAMLHAQAERQRSIYQFDVDMFQMTQRQKTQLLQGSLVTEYDQEKALLDKKMALYAGQPEKVAEVQKQISALEQTYISNRLRIAQDGIRQQLATWKEMTDSLQSSFNSQLRGLFAGTTSWSQAFKNVLGDMIIFFIQAIEKMVVNWLLGKAVMAAADKTALVEQSATAVAANAAAGAATIASIQQKVALVYAGAAAFFAPLLGPGAPAAALAVAAEVGAAATGFALAGSAEQGAYEVTGGLWQLHDKETVLPAPAAQAFRDFAEGNGAFAGGGMHFHGQFIDGPSIARFVRTNAGMFSDALRGHRALNPS